MKTTIQSIVGVLLVASSAHAQQATQWKVSDGGNGHWYAVQSVPDGITWTAARDQSASAGGHLATATSAAENAFCFGLVPPTSPVWVGTPSSCDTCCGCGGPWIGGYQDQDASDYSEPTGGWRWVTDEPWEFVAWYGPVTDDGNGNREAFLHYWRSFLPGAWNDNEDLLNRSTGFIVEWSADCNNDGTVDYGQCRDGSLPDANGNNIPDCCESSQACVVASSPVQWRVANGGNGHWFGLGAPAANWHAAAADAASKGGHLATLRSIGETAFAASVAGGENVAYIGAVQAPGSAEPFSGWRWITGEPWGYESWHFNMDDAPCGSSAGDGEQQFLWMHNTVRQWDDVNDQDLPGCPLESKRGIVEWSADCNGDGIVDYGQCRDGSLPDYNGNNIPDCCENDQPCVVGSYPVQWEVSEGGNGHWYRVVLTGQQICWTAAEQLARQNGGYLCSETSLPEHEFVSRNLVSQPSAWSGRWGPWIGATQTDAGWSWSTGEPWVFSAWYPGEPNGGAAERFASYIAIGEGGGCGTTTTWNDWVDCGGVETTGCDLGVWNLLVEWSADCNNDGIVDKGQILLGQLPDTNENGVPDTCEVPTCRDADIYRDFNVNGADLGILLSQWGPNTPLTESDLNKDGAVDGLDLGLLLSFWGPCP